MKYTKLFNNHEEYVAYTAIQALYAQTYHIVYKRMSLTVRLQFFAKKYMHTLFMESLHIHHQLNRTLHHFNLPMDTVIHIHQRHVKKESHMERMKFLLL